MVECLTGFKWIAAAQAQMEKDGSSEYVFGLEESYGYKVEKEVMDKDGVSAAAMCAEMTLYWASQGKSVLEHLDDMWAEYGYFEDRAISQYFEGPQGPTIMGGIMTKLRTEGLKSLGGKKVLQIKDIQQSGLRAVFLVEFAPAGHHLRRPADIGPLGKGADIRGVGTGIGVYGFFLRTTGDEGEQRHQECKFLHGCKITKIADKTKGASDTDP